MHNQNLSNTPSSPPKEQPEDLSSLFTNSKNSKTPKPLDQKKDEYLTDIRSQKRELYLDQKRLGTEENSTILQEEDAFGKGLSLKDFIADCLERKFTLKQIDELVSCLDSPSLYQQYFAAIGLSKLITLNPENELAIDMRVIPIFIKLLQREEEPQLQELISSALSNMASKSSEQIKIMVNNGAIPLLISLLKSQNKAIQAESISILGNIIMNSVEYRNAILQEGAVYPLVKITEEAISEGDKKMIKRGTLALASFWKGKPLVSYEKVKDTVPVLAKVMMNEEDEEVLTEVGWSLSRLYNGDPEQIQQVLETGVVPFLGRYIDHSNFVISLWCLRIIGNIFLGSQEQVDTVLNTPGILDKMFKALQSSKKTIRREAACSLSSITTSTKHIEFIVGIPENLDLLSSLSCGKDSDSIMKRNVATILKNLIKIGNQEQLRVLFGKNIIEHFGKLIGEEGLQEIGLEGMLEILNLEGWRAPEGFTRGICWALLEKEEKIPVTEGLRNHKNGEIAELACKILEEYKKDLE